MQWYAIPIIPINCYPPSIAAITCTLHPPDTKPWVNRSPSQYFLASLMSGNLNLLTKIGTQRERAILVQFLVTCPAHGIAHSLHFNLSSKLQPFPIGHVRKHKLCLANLSRQRIAGVQTTAREHLPVRALHAHPQYARHARDAVICEADNQPQVTIVRIAPDERGPHPIANSAIDPVKRCRISLVVAHQILCVDLVKVPQRPVVCPDIDHMSDHVFCRGYSFVRSARIGRFAGNPLLEQCRDPGWTIAESFNLLVLDKDGVTADPIVG